jgi:hypothetical protein
LPTRLPTIEVAGARLAQGRVHVVDEHLGEQDRLALCRLALALQAQQDHGQHGGDGVEAARHRVGHACVAIQSGARPSATTAS